MAISVSASSTTLPSLSRQSSTKLSSASHFSSKLSFSSSLQFQPIRIANASISLRHRPMAVEAKKQTFNSFDELLANSDKPVLVDFYATWCGPCQIMVPVLNQVSSTLQDKIQVVKIDTEKYPSIADKYRIQALPTFILFKDGKPSDRFEGALTADQLIKCIENSLNVRQ